MTPTEVASRGISMTDSLLTSNEVNDSAATNVEEIDDGDYEEEESEIEVEDVSME